MPTLPCAPAPLVPPAQSRAARTIPSPSRSTCGCRRSRSAAACLASTWWTPVCGWFGQGPYRRGEAAAGVSPSSRVCAALPPARQAGRLSCLRLRRDARPPACPPPVPKAQAAPTCRARRRSSQTATTLGASSTTRQAGSLAFVVPQCLGLPGLLRCCSKGRSPHSGQRVRRPVASPLP